MQTEFIKAIEEIANSLNVRLATTNKDIYTYYFYFNDNFLYKDKNIWEMLSNDKKINCLFSCAERKVFSLGNYYYDMKDILYVKFPPCSECILGIFHEYQQRNCFEVVSSLLK